jgi:hypothetical protein
MNISFGKISQPDATNPWHDAATSRFQAIRDHRNSNRPRKSLNTESPNPEISVLSRVEVEVEVDEVCILQSLPTSASLHVEISKILPSLGNAKTLPRTLKGRNKERGFKSYPISIRIVQYSWPRPTIDMKRP